MNLRSRVASALSFAHLAGLPASGKPAAAEDDDKDKKDPAAAGDDNDKKDQNTDNGDSKNSKAADDNDKKQRDGESDDDYAKRMEGDDGDKKKDAKSDADDEDEEMRGNSPVAAARGRERARCAAIFASRHAAKNVALAANLAFNTTMTREQAIDVLRDSPAPQNTARQARNPDIGGGGEQARPPAAANTERMVSKLLAAASASGQHKGKQ